MFPFDDVIMLDREMVPDGTTDEWLYPTETMGVFTYQYR